MRSTAHPHAGASKRASLGALMASTMLLLGCAAQAPTGLSCNSGEQPATVDTLYFGTKRPNGQVEPLDWESFLASGPLAGATHWTASGIWTSVQGHRVQEPVHVVQIVHGDGEPINHIILDMIMRYRGLFRQHAVLRLRSPACTSGVALN